VASFIPSAKKKLIGDEKLSPQEARGAKRFALAAMAGELATHYGITGWKAGDALKGVRECFNQWHGDSRFSLLDGSDDYPVHNRAGYYTREVGKLTYLFNDDGMKEATKENGLKRTIETLIKRGWLEKQGTRYKKLQRIDGSGLKIFTSLKLRFQDFQRKPISKPHQVM
jgi:putative DNA primase/helicase